jgi:hypothetical protein
MIDNDITLPVDLINDGNFTDYDYERSSTYENRSTFQGEDHDPQSRDLLQFYRTAAKPTPTFRGVQKSAVKFTMDKTVTAPNGDPIVAPVIIEVSFSVPIGVSIADEIIARQRVIALLDQDDIMNDLVHYNLV